MNIAKEKETIYSLLGDIIREQSRLTDTLNKRLDVLNQLEQVEMQSVREMKEELPLSHYVDKFNSQREVEVEVKNDYIIPKEEIEKEKDKDGRRSPYLNRDKVVGVISSVLREKGIPMNVKDIHEEVQEKLGRKVTIHNFRNNILPRACQKNRNITKAMRGYYQYKTA